MATLHSFRHSSGYLVHCRISTILTRVVFLYVTLQLVPLAAGVLGVEVQHDKVERHLNQHLGHNLESRSDTQHPAGSSRPLFYGIEG